MNIDSKKAVMEVCKKHVCGLIEAHFDKIEQAIHEKQETAGETQQVKLHVALGVDIAPRDDHTKVSASISYGVTVKDSTQAENISDQPELPGT